MIKVGADPELFLQTLAGKLKSSVGLIGGSKDIPRLISEEGHAVQEDNVAVEFNIPPANNADEFVKHITYTLDYLEKYAKEKGLVFSKLASASFPDDELQTPEAMVFGCEPDYNAYTEETNPRPFCPDLNLRSCGGHVHVGTTLPKFPLVKAMDVFLGLPSLFMDEDRARRGLYGRAGACRPKKYGVEYRTLSNFWIWSPDLIRWVYGQTQKAVSFVESGMSVKDERLVCEAINTSNLQLGEQLMRKYEVS